ncbi:ester cyclase [Deinococcus pimensis]|uniref:ester cyclase n=1 Tax=Deinococcus pimensis TaxID=309888 RepID=UPI0004B40763|nr:ester cyclase [Deinococcus pimensis]
MTSTQAPQALQDMMDAFNAGDLDRFRQYLDPNLTYTEPATGSQAQSADAYLKLCEGWRRAFPDLHGTIERVVMDGDTVVEEITWDATHDGPLDTPGGTIPATGRRISSKAVFWAVMGPQGAREVVHYLDLATIMNQLGLLGTPASVK